MEENTNARVKPLKPLGYKAYGSTPHLVGSRVGPGDYTLPQQQSDLFTGGRPARRGDRFILTEKLDGSCVSIARVDGEIVALGRAGYLASDSPYELHKVFARWVAAREERYKQILRDGERLVGEWLHTAMGSLYRIEDPEELLVGFAIVDGQTRRPYDDFSRRMLELGHPKAKVLSDGPQVSIEEAMNTLGEHGFHGSLDGPEGAVWVHERDGVFSAIAKYVRHDKVDGRYLPNISGNAEVVNYVGPEI